MHVQSETDGTAVWRLRLRPGDATGTMLDREGVARLAAILDEADSTPGCRVVVIEGGRGCFCQGMDLGQIVENPQEDQTGAIADFARCLDRMRSTRCVVIAAVDGTAAGGGVGLAAGADIAIATERSSFGLPELVLGLLPAVVLPVLLERIPPQKARLLTLSSSIDAQAALAMGLIDRVVEGPERLEKAVRTVIKQALRTNPEAVGEMKRLCADVAGLDCSRALEVGSRRAAELIADQDRFAAIRAFLEGEPLPWFERYRDQKAGSS